MGRIIARPVTRGKVDYRVLLQHPASCSNGCSACWWLTRLYELVVASTLSSPKICADDSSLFLSFLGKQVKVNLIRGRFLRAGLPARCPDRV